ncbi:histone deacetylase family protein [Dokdonella sp.]|uniref:histone deacetylase family protein n=1 Tax=Dokdonella sp. TaxID=2291710 RepID=UPI003C45ADE5
MKLAVYSHAACHAHDPGPGHPESPSRIVAVMQALEDPACLPIHRIEAQRATREQLERVHTPAHIDTVLGATPASGYRYLDADTVVSTGSVEAALRAAGAVCQAVDAVMSGGSQRAFCAVRPPGHHATASVAMGFCLFNNIAVGAAQALLVHGIERVAIVDFDVHHGNGTADIFAADARVLYTSTHQSPLYPGTGARSQHGVGNLLHEPLPAGARSDQFRAAYETRILPALDAFAPQLLMISAGFDAHRLDPLANLDLETEDFAWVSRQLLAIAEKHCSGRVISSLEGGYSLTALRESTMAHINALSGS